MMKFNARKAVAVLAAVATLGVAGPVAVTAAQAADAPAAAQTASQDVTVTFHYTDKQGNETGYTQVPDAKGTAFSKFAAAVDTPSLPGYTFTGWTDYRNVYKVTDATPVTKDMDLYPAYVEAESEQVTVKFTDGRDPAHVYGTATLDKDTAFADFVAGAKPETPTSEGNKFAGWTVDGFTALPDGYKVAKDTEVVPLWTLDTTTPAAKQLTVVFHGRDGQPGWPVEKTLERGTVFSEFLKALDGYTLPSMDGHTLKGWAVKDSQNVIDGDVHMDFETDSIDLYPVFEANPVSNVTVVFYDANDAELDKVALPAGTAFSEFAKQAESKLQVPAGKKLAGWYFAGAEDKTIDGAEAVNADGWNVYPKLEDTTPAPVKVNVVFHDNKGDVLANIDGTSGDPFDAFTAKLAAEGITAPAVPGQEFVAWSVKGGAATPELVTGDLDVYPAYKATPKPQPQYPWWAHWWGGFQHWWGSWNQWFGGWWR